MRPDRKILLVVAWARTSTLVQFIEADFISFMQSVNKNQLSKACITLFCSMAGVFYYD